MQRRRFLLLLFLFLIRLLLPLLILSDNNFYFFDRSLSLLFLSYSWSLLSSSSPSSTTHTSSSSSLFSAFFSGRFCCCYSVGSLFHCCSFGFDLTPLLPLLEELYFPNPSSREKVAVFQCVFSEDVFSRRSRIPLQLGKQSKRQLLCLLEVREREVAGAGSAVVVVVVVVTRFGRKVRFTESFTRAARLGRTEVSLLHCCKPGLHFSPFSLSAVCYLPSTFSVLRFNCCCCCYPLVCDKVQRKNYPKKLYRIG